jgi:hypothetical protein
MSNPWVIGQAYFIRTATYHATGRLKAIYDQELVFSEAAWIADSGRFNAALVSGSFSEVEPFPNDLIIFRGAGVDATTLDTPLPSSVKP